MGSFTFFLGLEEPEIYFTGAQQYIVCFPFKIKRGENVIRPIAYLINDGLNRLVGLDIPDFNYFVGAQRNQVVFLFVDC